MALRIYMVTFAVQVLNCVAFLLTMAADWLVEYSAQLYYNKLEISISPLPVEVKEDRSVKRMENLLSQIFSCSEIIEVIFKHSDIGRIKKCRLVCKAWNQEICRSVARDKWVASLSEKHDLAEFEAFLKNRRNGTELPLPFRNISIGSYYKCRIPSGSCLWLRAYELLQVTKLDISGLHPVYSTVSNDSAEFLLRCYSTILTHLRTSSALTLEDGDNRAATLKFPHLRVLQVFYDKDLDESANILREKASIFLGIISGAPSLKSLSIWGVPFAAEILEAVGSDKQLLSSVKSLDVFCGNSPLPVTGNFKQLMRGVQNLRSVSHLGIECYFSGGEEQLNQLQQTLAAFSAQLKSLCIGDTLPGYRSIDQRIRLPTFPQLTTLNLNVCSIHSLDLRSFPQLHYLICGQVKSHVSGGQDPRGFSASVRGVSVMNRIIGPHYREASSNEQVSTFLAFFSNFQNARAWSIHFENSVSFCRAVTSSGFPVKSLVIMCDGREGDDDEKLAHDDRFIFSYVELLKDLETLVLFSRCFAAHKELHAKMLDPKRMQKLKNLVVCSGFKPKLENYRNLVGEEVKVTIVGSSKGIHGNEEILSQMENSEFHFDSSAYFHRSPWWDRIYWDD